MNKTVEVDTRRCLENKNLSYPESIGDILKRIIEISRKEHLND